MARLDTVWHADPKLLKLGFAGMGLHAWSISYCDYVRSDGFIPDGAWPSLPGVATLVKALVSAGLWEPCDGGYWLHKFLEYNRSRAQIEALQEDARERQSRHRSRVTNGVTKDEAVRDDGVTQRVTLARAGAPGPVPGYNSLAAAAARTPERGLGETSGLPIEVIERLSVAPIGDRSSSSSSSKFSRESTTC